MNETLILAALIIPGLVIAIVFHEVAHGWTALALGDPTAQEQRRLSLNPLRHVDLFGTLILPGFLALTGAPVFGWAKPVPVNKWRLRNPRFGMMAVAIAGPGVNFVLALVGAVLLGVVLRGEVPGTEPSLWVVALFNFILMNTFLGLFNLLPVPPFDGSHIVEGLLPPAAARIYARARPYGLLLVFGLLLIVPWLFPGLGVIERVVLPPVNWAQGFFLALAGWIAE
jgi:Zn-dependent protease